MILVMNVGDPVIVEIYRYKEIICYKMTHTEADFLGDGETYG